MIDADAIVDLTKSVFKNSPALKGPLVSSVDYDAIHTSPLVPLNLNIDADQFLTDIKTFSNYFEKWGKEFDLPRYGLALVNRRGILHTPDVVNGSLMEWNRIHPNEQYTELDFQTPTNVLTVPSLKALSVFNGYWCRSNIFKLEAGSYFHPHIDTVVPSPWLRLWSTTDAKNTVVRFYNSTTKEMEVIDNIESGRIYLIDTSCVHDAHCSDTVYHLFLSVRPGAYKIIKEVLWN
jgi:hypothetical protein